MVITSLLLTAFLNIFVNVSCEKCRTNNDCDSGRCEWRRCVGKLGKVISGRMEIENCYVDDDCPEKQVCRGNFCQDRLPLITDIVVVQAGRCFADAHCPAGFKCGFYKKCYDISDRRYTMESFMHIPCKHEAPEFCAEVTGYETAVCREIYFAHENIRAHICQLPPPFVYAEQKRDWYWEAANTFGSPAHFFFWRTGQPETTDEKRCVYAGYAGEWMSADCDNFVSPRRFVCQSPSYAD